MDPQPNQPQSTPPAQPVVTPVEPPKPKSKKWLWIIIGIVLLLVVGIGGIYLGSQLSPQPIPAPEAMAPSPTPDLTSSWRQLNIKHWSFKIPPDWKYFECLSSDAVFVGPTIQEDKTDECAFESAGVVSIVRDKNQIKPIAESNTDVDILSQKELVVDGQSSVLQKTLVKQGQAAGYWTTVYVQNENYTDLISEIGNGYPTIFDQILSTFKFINSPDSSASKSPPVIPSDWKQYSAEDYYYGIKTSLSLPPNWSFAFTGSEDVIRNESTDELWRYSSSTRAPDGIFKNLYDGGSRRSWYTRYLAGEFSDNTVDKKIGDLVSVSEVPIGTNSYLSIKVNVFQRTETHYVFLQNNIIHILQPFSDPALSAQAELPSFIGAVFYSLRSVESK